MTKQTAKYVAAVKCWKSLNKRKSLPDKYSDSSESLYSHLFAEGWEWDRKSGCYVEMTDKAFRGGYGSIFQNDDGSPSKVVHVRVMCNPAMVDQVVEAVSKHLLIGEVSTAYPNRGGQGVRVYINARLQGSLK